MCGMMAKITKAQNSLNQRFQRLPSHDEIAEVIKVNASTVKLVCERSRPPISLDRVVTVQGSMTLQVCVLNLVFMISFTSSISSSNERDDFVNSYIFLIFNLRCKL